MNGVAVKEAISNRKILWDYEYQIVPIADPETGKLTHLKKIYITVALCELRDKTMKEIVYQRLSNDI